MTKWINRIAITALLLATAIPALADALPDPSWHKSKEGTPGYKVRMVVTHDYEYREARLVIPRSVWKQLQADSGANGQQVGAAQGRSLNLTGVQTAIAGVFLSLSLAFAGMWFVRTRKRFDAVARTAIGVAALAILAAAGSIAYANAGPPPSAARSLTPAMLAPEVRRWGSASGDVYVTIDDENRDRPVILYLPDKK